MHNKPQIRQLLFLPANKEELFAKALQTEADLVIFDFEDSVAATDKQNARNTLFNWIKKNPINEFQPIGIRINSLYTQDGLLDILALQALETMPDYIMLPKVESEHELIMVEKIINTANNNVSFILIIESAKGVLNIERIIRSSPNIAYVLVGAADLSSDINCKNSREALQYSNSRVLVACTAYKIPVIDSPFFDLESAEALLADTIYGSSIGFSARAAIHPKQLKIINSIYTPSAKQIAEANEIIAMAEKGIGIVNGQMIDEAMAIKARKMLARAKLDGRS